MGTLHRRPPPASLRVQPPHRAPPPHCAAIMRRPSSTPPAKPTRVGRLLAATLLQRASATSAVAVCLPSLDLACQPQPLAPPPLMQSAGRASTSPASRNHCALSPAHVATSFAGAASCPSAAVVAVIGASEPSHVPPPASTRSRRRRQPLPLSPTVSVAASRHPAIAKSDLACCRAIGPCRPSPAAAPTVGHFPARSKRGFGGHFTAAFTSTHRHHHLQAPPPPLPNAATPPHYPAAVISPSRSGRTARIWALSHTLSSPPAPAWRRAKPRRRRPCGRAALPAAARAAARRSRGGGGRERRVTAA